MQHGLQCSALCFIFCDADRAKDDFQSVWKPEAKLVRVLSMRGWIKAALSLIYMRNFCLPRLVNGKTGTYLYLSLCVHRGSSLRSPVQTMCMRIKLGGLMRMDNSLLLNMCLTGLAKASKCLASGFLSWCACRLIRRCEPHSERSQAGCMHACCVCFCVLSHAAPQRAFPTGMAWGP